MKKICDYIQYLPAVSEPLSADVYFIEGEKYCYIFDVGNNEEALEAISKVDKDKVVIISHYHKDHTGNIDKVDCKTLYVGDLTYEMIHKGTIVEESLIIHDGLEIEIRHCTSPHVNGSLVMIINNEYTLLGDVYSVRDTYDKELAHKMLDELKQIDTTYFVNSHLEECVVEKDILLEELCAYFNYSG